MTVFSTATDDGLVHLGADHLAHPDLTAAARLLLLHAHVVPVALSRLTVRTRAISTRAFLILLGFSS